MKRLALAGALALALSAPLTALAAQRTFVSVDGIDGQPCSLPQPCRTFTAAMAQTNAGGEVIALDSGGYGAVTITKSVSIVAPAGVYAGISVFGGAGVTVAAGSTDSVTLRGLAINAQGGSQGVAFTSGGKLELDRVTISGAFSHGIYVNGPLTPLVLIKDTHIADAGVAITVGGPGSELIRMTVIDSVLSHVGGGINFYAGGEFTVANSRLIGTSSSSGTAVSVSGTAVHGAIAGHVANTLIREFGLGVGASTSGSTAKVSVATSELTYLSTAVWLNGGTVALTGNRLAHNNTVVSAPPGSVAYSSGNNATAYNVSSGSPVTAGGLL